MLSCALCLALAQCLADDELVWGMNSVNATTPCENLATRPHYKVRYPPNNSSLFLISQLSAGQAQCHSPVWPVDVGSNFAHMG
jgi:hypothetical protein